jgi:hypothetical protein
MGQCTANDLPAGKCGGDAVGSRVGQDVGRIVGLDAIDLLRERLEYSELFKHLLLRNRLEEWSVRTISSP